MRSFNIVVCGDSTELGRACSKGFDYLLFDPSEAKSLKWNGLELHEVYNEAEEPIGVASCQAIEKLNLIRKSVHLFFFNNLQELLLQKMPRGSQMENLLFPSAFGILGIDEAPAQAALRVMKESLCIEEPLYYLGKLKSFSDHAKEFVYCFMCVSKSKPQNPNSSQRDFYSLKEIEKMDSSGLSPVLKDELKRFMFKMKRELKKKKQEQKKAKQA